MDLIVRFGIIICCQCYAGGRTRVNIVVVVGPFFHVRCVRGEVGGRGMLEGVSDLALDCAVLEVESHYWGLAVMRDVECLAARLIVLGRANGNSELGVGLFLLYIIHYVFVWFFPRE
jgi:hypothetical protein